ncbi:MAG: Uncharacterised protein [Marinobacterium sp. xm-d-530]|nr:MAG: Uncharacterised protein [Marinobacterium sp. xm-d-530]
MYLINTVKDFSKGKSAGITYLVLGFVISIPLGLASLRIDRRLDILAGYDVLEYSHRALVYGLASGILLLITLVFLAAISSGILGYFKKNSGLGRWVLLVLAIVHAPITSFTALVYGTSILRVGGAIIRHIH